MPKMEDYAYLAFCYKAMFESSISAFAEYLENSYSRPIDPQIVSSTIKKHVESHMATQPCQNDKEIMKDLSRNMGPFYEFIYDQANITKS